MTEKDIMYFVLIGIIIFEVVIMLALSSTIAKLRREKDELVARLYYNKRFWWTQEELDTARETAHMMSELLDDLEQGREQQA